MLSFVCNSSDFNSISSWFVKNLAEIIKSNKVQTLAADYWDDNIEEKLHGLIRRNAKGFVFDEDDLIGDEPYGYVSDFFESYLCLIEDLKGTFPNISLSGYVFVNENGVYDCVLRQGLYSSYGDSKIDFFDQLQCVWCNEWIDASEALVLLSEDEIDMPIEDGDPLYPSAYSKSGLTAAYCICSENCKEDMLESAPPEFREELEEHFN